MSRYKSILDTDDIWAKEKRQPGKAEICFGSKHRNEKRGHAVFISGVGGESIVYYYRAAQSMQNYISGSTMLVLEAHCFSY